MAHFSRLAAATGTAHEVLGLLAQAAVDYLAADGAAVLEIGQAGEAAVAKVARAPELAGLRFDFETIGPELSQNILAACQGQFTRTRVLPLVSDSDLFGALVLLFKSKKRLDPSQRQLAAGLADLAAAALGKAYRIEQLSRAYAELNASREILARSEKLRALGEMAAGIAHDLRNILSPLTVSADTLSKNSHDSERVMRVAQMIKRAVKRGVDTTERLRFFSRQMPEAQQIVDLNALVAEAVELCQPRLRSGGAAIELQVETTQPPPIRVESSELVTAILNLVVNAIEAMPTGGTITVKTGEAAGGGFVQVSDTGPGLSPEVERRIFEPFFTTKGDNGTGLGLAMVYAFVQRQGGNIQIDSQPGKGAAFTLWFADASDIHPQPLSQSLSRA